MNKLMNSLCYTLVFLFSFSIYAQDIQRVRIDVTTPNEYVRHLLLGFTPDDSATDGYDYGYDAPNPDNFPDDASWIIDNQQYVIQGVGCFDETKQYPLGLFLSNPGEIKIELDILENFEQDISVYVYDALLDTYDLINESSFTFDSSSGDHIDRFYIAFSNSNLPANSGLSVNDLSTEKNVKIHYIYHTNELIVNSKSNIKSIEIFDISGKKLEGIFNINSTEKKFMLTEKNQIILVNIITENTFFSKKVLIF